MSPERIYNERSLYSLHIWLLHWQTPHFLFPTEKYLYHRILSWRSVIKVDANELSFFPVSPAMLLRLVISCCAWNESRLKMSLVRSTDEWSPLSPKRSALEMDVEPENFCRETWASTSVALLWSPKNWADEIDFAFVNFFLASSVSSIWQQ